jgi:glycosyltransferase involved in cell wall biosynthesis
VAPGLRRDLRQLGFRRPILIAGLPHVADLAPRLPRSTLVYHCADDYAHVRGFPSSLPGLEADLCRTADLVITTSETLCRARQQFNPRTYWVPNGADVAHFSAPVEPALELRDIPRPVVGFVGGLSEWVDIELLASLARARPAWSFVLVGPVGVDVSALRAQPNVHLLGARPYAEVPRFLAGIDVALIPFRPTPVSLHADPIKAYEYLAAGVPVVASDLPALRRLVPLLALAADAAGFLSAIEAALADGRDAGRGERQAASRAHSWDARFERIDTLIADARCAS